MPEVGRQRLYEMLATKFHQGIEARTTFVVRDLIDAARQDGIDFWTPPTFKPTGLPTTVRDALFVLQECPSGLPIEVLAAGLDCPKDELHQELSRHIEGGFVVNDDGIWKVIPFKPPLSHDAGDMLCSRTLEQLLEFIRRNKTSPKIMQHVTTAIALGKICRSFATGLVANLFSELQTLLKRNGDKHLVLEVANLSISAARTEPRNIEQHVKGEAVALICGLSWVFQRIDRIEQAMAHGLESLKVGEDIGWNRNTAFCRKCLGRLFRMKAERNEPNFEELVQSSVDSLLQAIEIFGTKAEIGHGKREDEIGDCYSLLGRTYLVAGDIVKCGQCVREARNRVTDKTTKDYADLLILEGDMARASKDRPAAESFYDQALKVVSDVNDAEKSEIAARAFFAKGCLTREVHYFDKAAQIWDRLDERRNADNARWYSIKGSVPDYALGVLRSESPSVGVEMMRLHNERVAGLTGSYRGRRDEPDQNYWKNLLVVAKDNAAVRRIEW